MKETVARIMSSPAYSRALDGKAAQKGTRQAMLTGTVAKYREAAGKLLMRDANVRKAVALQNMKGRAAVAARDGAKAGGDFLGQLGSATGVDLGGIFTANE